MLATLSYLSDDPIYETEKPFKLFGFPVEQGKNLDNLHYDVHDDIRVADIRSLDVTPTLDTTGFQVIQHRSECPLDVKRFEFIANRDEVLIPYIQETIALVKDTLSASRVFCFDWRLRRNATAMRSESDYQREGALPAAEQIHCDFSLHGGRERLARHVSENELTEMEEGRCRVRMFNIWRPFHKVANGPLLLCDRRSVKPADLFEFDKVGPDKVEEGLLLKYDADQRWYHLSAQSPEEVWFFMTWDSACGDTVVGPPHGACQKPIVDNKTLPRESIEVRVIAMTGV